jgi:5,10-methylene-tetrahydrofolate dehydrogenase/methenyl tetrahydrofolate cyclohydrolase
LLPDGTHGVEVRQGDVIKFGRVPYYVKEVNYSSESPKVTETESEYSEVSEVSEVDQVDQVKKIMSNFPLCKSFNQRATMETNTNFDNNDILNQTNASGLFLEKEEDANLKPQSTRTIESLGEKQGCRICLGNEESAGDPLVSPCQC